MKISSLTIMIKKAASITPTVTKRASYSRAISLVFQKDPFESFLSRKFIEEV